MFIYLVCLGLALAASVAGQEHSYNHTVVGSDNEALLPSHVSRKALIQGRYRSGEAISQQNFFQPGKMTRVRWRAKPAKGDCVISLFSIFNANILFNPSIPDSQKPPWTEIAFETFGGSVGRNDAKQFQSQYISQDDPNAPPTQRGDQHVVNHFLPQRNIPNIYDGKFHTFDIIFQPAGNNKDAQIQYRLDGKLIRNVVGGDANFLVPPLQIYAGVWAGTESNGWACTGTRDRPDSAQVQVIRVDVHDYDENARRWRQQKRYRFRDQNSLNQWILSDWSFSSFDGAFDPSAVRLESNRMKLDLLRN